MRLRTFLFNLHTTKPDTLSNLMNANNYILTTTSMQIGN